MKISNAIFAFVCLGAVAFVLIASGTAVTDFKRALSTTPDSRGSGSTEDATPSFGQLKLQSRDYLKQANRRVRMQGPNSPNLIVVSMNNLHLPVFQTASCETPMLDRMLRYGVVFDNFYAGCNRWQGLIGLHAGQTDVNSADPWRLATSLWKTGYFTGIIGDHSFLKMSQHQNGASCFDLMFEVSDRYGAADNSEVVDSNELLFRKTEQTIQQHSEGRPFFLHLVLSSFDFVSTERPERPIAESVERQRCAELALVQLNQTLVRLNQCLNRTGIEKHTVVILVGDGNQMGGSIALDDVREYDMRSILVFYCDGRFKPGYRSNILAGMPDLNRTLIDIAQSRSPTIGTGISLLPALNRLGGRTDRSLVWIHPQDSNLAVVRDGNWKAIFGTNAQLFDVLNDPNEAVNLASQHPTVVSQLRTAVRKHTTQF